MRLFHRLFFIVLALSPLFSYAQEAVYMVDANLEEASLPRYRYSPNKDQVKSKNKDAYTRQAHLKEMLTQYEQMPEYMKKAIEVAIGESKGSLRLDKPSVDYDAQELRGQLLNHIDDISKMQRILGVLYGDPNIPYHPVEKIDDKRVIKEQGKTPSQSVSVRHFSSSTARMRPKRETFRGRIYRQD